MKLTPQEKKDAINDLFVCILIFAACIIVCLLNIYIGTLVWLAVVFIYIKKWWDNHGDE